MFCLGNLLRLFHSFLTKRKTSPGPVCRQSPEESSWHMMQWAGTASCRAEGKKPKVSQWLLGFMCITCVTMVSLIPGGPTVSQWLLASMRFRSVTMLSFDPHCHNGQLLPCGPAVSQWPLGSKVFYCNNGLLASMRNTKALHKH